MKFYDILEVKQDATQEEIKKSYKKLAVKYHPDRDGGNEEKFKEISHAYDVLGDPEKRKRYDLTGDTNGGGDDSHFANPNDIFASMFGGGNPFDIFGRMGGIGGMGMGGMGMGQRQRSHHVHAVKMSLKDAFAGVQKQIKVSIQKPCLKCKETCYSCQGRGHIVQHIRNGIFTQIVQGPCGDCQGQGIKITAKPSCGNCAGAGHTQENKTLTLTIPAGVTQGTQIRFAGFGEQVMTEDEKAGDLVFEIHVEEHPLFMRNNDDLHYETTIKLSETITGTTITIPMFDGDIVLDTRTLGNGFIQPHHKYVLNGKGMPNASNNNNNNNNSKKRGNLLLSFKIQYPTKKLDEKEVEQLRNLFSSVGM